jgi:hypothetical protein
MFRVFHFLSSEVVCIIPLSPALGDFTQWLSKVTLTADRVLANHGNRYSQIRQSMPTALINLLKNLRSPLMLIVASYVGLRALEIALRPQEAFRNRTAHKLMTLSATGLFLLVVVFLVAEILGALGVISPPWPANFPAGRS